MKIIGIDVGDSIVRMSFGTFDGVKLSVMEYRSFANRPIDIGCAMYWDVLSLHNSIIEGLHFFRKRYGEADLVGIDALGAAYGLLDYEGRLLEPVYHGMDMRTDKVMEIMKKVVSEYELFRLTGCQCNRTYTLPQLFSYHVNQSRVLEMAKTFLMLPDLLGYFLTGVETTEMTIAGTTGMMENRLKNWSREIAWRFSIPNKIYTEIVDHGTYKGRFSKRVQLQTGMRKTKLATTVEHDMAAAVAAIPGFGEDQIFIRIGTNASIGFERENCQLSEDFFEKGFNNTGGIHRSKIVYRDFPACRHIYEFIRSKREKGVDYSFTGMAALAEGERKSVPWFDVEETTFKNIGGDMCEKMNSFFRRTGQRILEEDGEFIKSIYESIALKINHHIKSLHELGITYKKINVIGGTVRNVYMIQTVCNAVGENLFAGMEFASLTGNMLVQLLTCEEVDSVEEIRNLSEKNFWMREYVPRNRKYWKEITEKYEEIMTNFDYTEK